MKTVIKTAEYTVLQKKSGRYAVISADKKYINGDDKARILIEAGLVKAVVPQQAPAEEVAEQTAEAAPEAAAEEVSEEAPAADAVEESTEEEKSGE